MTHGPSASDTTLTAHVPLMSSAPSSGYVMRRGGPFNTMASHDDIQAAFDKAVQAVKSSPPKSDASNEEKLKVYALYKQATEGDVSGSAPWAINVVAKAKYDAWKALKGMSKEDAMQQYVEVTKAQLS